MHGDVRFAAMCLVACVAFDGLDGALARKLGVSSPFGAQMDSLADMCSFGLAAPVVVYASLAGTVSTPAAAVSSDADIQPLRFEHEPAARGELFYGPHHRAEARDVVCPRAQRDRRQQRRVRTDRVDVGAGGNEPALDDRLLAGQRHRHAKKPILARDEHRVRRSEEDDEGDGREEHGQRTRLLAICVISSLFLIAFELIS